MKEAPPTRATVPSALREDELRTHAKCSLCERGIGHTHLPLFWRVRIDRFGIDLDAARRQDGLTELLGGHALLARVMGPDSEMAKPMMATVTLTVCEHCAVEGLLPIAVLAERAAPNEDEG